MARQTRPVLAWVVRAVQGFRILRKEISRHGFTSPAHIVLLFGPSQAAGIAVYAQPHATDCVIILMCRDKYVALNEAFIGHSERRASKLKGIFFIFGSLRTRHHFTQGDPCYRTQDPSFTRRRSLLCVKMRGGGCFEPSIVHCAAIAQRSLQIDSQIDSVTRTKIGPKSRDPLRRNSLMQI